jgi:hypothetical protein
MYQDHHRYFERVPTECKGNTIGWCGFQNLLRLKYQYRVHCIFLSEMLRKNFDTARMLSFNKWMWPKD